ncbi:MAG: 30S ribosomal protein S8 [Planctomycetes bacterium]|nr:30S ribosomal protein S8 [Planctomycetota bacterium]
MSCTDPIADMLTIIRNGLMAGKKTVTIIHSNLKVGLCQVLKDEGYVERFDVLDTKPARSIQVGLKYTPTGESAIHHITRVSTPGCRIYRGKSELKPIIRGFGISILSTSKGILSDRVCRKQNLGGEVLCTVQ